MIDKLDTTFTSTRKGLMWLFTIGLVHTVLGTHIIGNEITIPTLPIIRIENPNYIYYLYWALVWYSIYRYFLHSKPIIRKLNIKSMGWLFEHSAFGGFILYRYIFKDKNDSFQTKIIDSSVTLEYQEIDDRDAEHPNVIGMYYIKFFSNESYFINAFKAYNTYTLQPTFQPLQKYGIHYFGNNQECESITVNPITDFKLSFLLKVANVYASLRLAIKDIQHFDIFFPPACNIVLFIFFLYSFLSA